VRLQIFVQSFDAYFALKKPTLYMFPLYATTINIKPNWI